MIFDKSFSKAPGIESRVWISQVGDEFWLETMEDVTHSHMFSREELRELAYTILQATDPKSQDAQGSS